MQVYKHENILHKQQFNLQFAIRFEIVEDYNFYSPFHWHNHIEVLYVIDGEIDFRVEDRNYTLKNGNMIIVNSELIHYSKLKGQVKYILLQVPLSAFDGIYDEIESVRFREVIDKKDAKVLCSNLLEMLSFVKNYKPNSKVKFVSLLYDFFYVLLNSFIDENKKLYYSVNNVGINRISPVMAYVEKNFRNKISLKDAADIINVTPEHLCRLFKKYANMTFNDYLMALRISSFYQSLQSSNQKISVLLEENGILNYKVFIREFKKTFGKTPEVIRQEKMKNNNGL